VSTPEAAEMKKKAIPDDVREKVLAIVERFNRKELRGSDCQYIARFQGKYLYRDRSDAGRVGPICRRTYTGEMDSWEFAIFRWSRERYDPQEWLFPGSEHVDGTIEGAMKAGMEAYSF
jgi:hypothetical protein